MSSARWLATGIAVTAAVLLASGCSVPGGAPIPDGVPQRDGDYDFSLRETLDHTRKLPANWPAN